LHLIHDGHACEWHKALLSIGHAPFAGPVERLREYAATYFALETDTLLAFPEKHFTTRINPLTKKRQVLTTDVLRFLLNRLPPDAFCAPAITMEDLSQCPPDINCGIASAVSAAEWPKAARKSNVRRRKRTTRWILLLIQYTSR
jgi:hypothetical protein